MKGCSGECLGPTWDKSQGRGNKKGGGQIGKDLCPKMLNEGGKEKVGGE